VIALLYFTDGKTTEKEAIYGSRLEDNIQMHLQNSEGNAKN
jgi:hypothetical protein